jgi:ASC-1-like (ASCH) protein
VNYSAVNIMTKKTLKHYRVEGTNFEFFSMKELYDAYSKSFDTCSIRSFSERMSQHVAGILSNTVELSLEDLMQCFTKKVRGLNLAIQNPVRIGEKEYQSNSALYQSVKKSVINPCSLRTFTDRMRKLRIEKRLASDMILTIGEKDISELINKINADVIMIVVIDSINFEPSHAYSQTYIYNKLSSLVIKACDFDLFNTRVGKKDTSNSVLICSEADLLELIKPPDSEGWRSYKYDLDVDGVHFDKCSEAYHALKAAPYYVIKCNIKDFTNRLAKAHKRECSDGDVLCINTKRLLAQFINMPIYDNYLRYEIKGSKLILIDEIYLPAIYCGITSMHMSDRLNGHINGMLSRIRQQKRLLTIHLYLNLCGISDIHVELIDGGNHVSKNTATAWEKSRIKEVHADKRFHSLNEQGGGSVGNAIPITDEEYKKALKIFWNSNDKDSRGHGRDIPYRIKQREGEERYNEMVLTRRLDRNYDNHFESAVNALKACNRADGDVLEVYFLIEKPKARRWRLKWLCNTCTTKNGVEVTHDQCLQEILNGKGCRFTDGGETNMLT